MEAFSLLKYWKGGGGARGDPFPGSRPTTTIVAATATGTSDDDDDNDDFFDLEFAVPDDDDGQDEDDSRPGEDKNDAAAAEDSDTGDLEEVEEEEEEEGNDGVSGNVQEGIGEFDFTLSSASSSSSSTVNDRTTASPSESDNLFFKGRLVVPIDASSEPASEPSSKPAHQFPVSSLLNKSATKFRVFLLGFKKPKDQTQSQRKQLEDDVVARNDNGKLFTVKFKVEEVPLVSLFTRENSRSQSHSQSQSKIKRTETAPSPDGLAREEAAVSEEHKRFSKEAVQKYLKKVKPLYVKVSKRYAERLRSSSAGEGREVERQVSLPLRVVYKHLGKSRSGSSLAVPAAADPASAVGAGGVASKRRDDSLLQQQDGIQGAILHCKRSFNASRDSDASLLARSVSENTASHEEFTGLLSRKPSD